MITKNARKVLAQIGSMGGKATAKKHGKKFFSKIGKIKSKKNRQVKK